MRTAAALLALVTASSIARADEPQIFYVPTPVYGYTAPVARHASARSITEEAVGGALLGLGSIAIVSSVGLGLDSFAKGFCGFDNGGVGCDATYAQADREQNAAIALGVVGVATAIAGSALLATGVHTRKHEMRFAAAPIVTSGGGASASFSMRF
jgi:hypothetical protein